jgi:hypothetical protein
VILNENQLAIHGNTLLLNEAEVNMMILETVLLEDSKQRAMQYKQKFENMRKDFLKKHHISEVTFQKYVKKYKSKLKIKNVNGKVEAKGFLKSVESLVKEIFQDMSAEGFGKAVSLFIIMLIIQSLIVIVISSLGLSGVMSAILAYGIILPIVEEVAKQISIREGFEGEFFIFFNALEFTGYVSNLVKGGMKMIKAILLRGAVIVMHFVTTVVQKAFDKYSDEEKQDGSKVAKFIGLVAGSFIHALWNITAILQSI